MKVLVLEGGDSPERAVSFMSSESVKKSLTNCGIDFVTYDPMNGFDGLKQAVKGCDVVLPILHGKNGEDGVIQKQLEELGVKYLGADSVSSDLSMNKVKTHKCLEENGILMPDYEVVDVKEFLESAKIKNPFVLKPIDGGSSIDIVIARNPDGNKLEQCKKLLAKYEKMLLEELIEGVQVTAPVLGVEALPVILIIPPNGKEFDYENKYNGQSQEICPIPEDVVSKEKQREIEEIVVKAHKCLGVRHLSRSEFIIKDNGSVYMLELNTIPGLTSESLYPRSAKVASFNMDQLVLKFIEMVKAEL